MSKSRQDAVPDDVVMQVLKRIILIRKSPGAALRDTACATKIEQLEILVVFPPVYDIVPDRDQNSAGQVLASNKERRFVDRLCR